jgi:hypothetical protein
MSGQSSGDAVSASGQEAVGRPGRSSVYMQIAGLMPFASFQSDMNKEG